MLLLGTGALCENNGNIAVCKCPPGFEGDPNVACRSENILDAIWHSLIIVDIFKLICQR